MRILHTSDWHLGQHFMGKSRQAEHQALIDWLLVQVDTHAVDAVLIAGDIFDTGAPPSYARELYSQLVVRLHGAGVALLLLGGNHDSVATLGESSALLACLSTTVVAAVAPRPVNVVNGGAGAFTVADLASLGVRRISLGGGLARAAWGGFLRAAQLLASEGRFDELASGTPGVELNKMFEG